MPSGELKKWQVTGSKYLVSDRWLRLRADTCISAAGHKVSPFYVMEYDDWATCLVLSGDNEVTVLRHYRHGIDDYVLEIVAGSVDEGETPEQAIRRELEEEIGLVGAAIRATGAFYANPSNQTNKVHCFIALGGTFNGAKQNEPGADFKVIKMPLSELIKIIQQQSEVMQGLHIASIFLALNFLSAK